MWMSRTTEIVPFLVRHRWSLCIIFATFEQETFTLAYWFVPNAFGVVPVNILKCIRRPKTEISFRPP